MLRVKNLRVHFCHDSGLVKAVDGIDFEINENEVVGLVGESGSGKTVTALSIMRLLPKNSSMRGEIIFRDENISNMTEEEILGVRGSEITMVFQEPFTSLNPVLRVGEQIDEIMLAHKNGMCPHNVKAETLRILEKVKMQDPQRMYNSYPHLLSGGERQRVMIAMAVMLRPKLLIADEPTTALDVTIQAEILELLLELKKDFRMAILFITHDFGIIKKIADRVLVMKNGKIVEKGKKAEVLASPKDAYTKSLLGAAFVFRSSNGGKSSEAVPSEPIITVKQLSKSFAIEKGIFKTAKEKIQAVNNISIEVKKGRTLGLVGESGSGKTTFGKLLIGLLRPDSGEIQVSNPSEPAAMQLVFQDPYSSLDPCMRMRDIVLEGLKIHGKTRGEKESVLSDVLFKARLNYRDSHKYPHHFSGGEKQRIAIARALAVNPKILILDEPVSSLDVIIQQNILNLLKKLQRELGLTYLFISHDIRAVAYMADDIAVMCKGEIVEVGPRDAVLEKPRHPYTKRLLSSVLYG